MRLPKISINISVITNGSADIALNSLKKVNYPRHLYEIILIEGNHLTRQRNIGFQHSKGEIVYLLDNDSQVHSGALRLLAKEFSSSKTAAVGGPSLTPKEGSSYFSKVIGYILETYFGAYRMRFKWSKQKSKKHTSDYIFI